MRKKAVQDFIEINGNELIDTLADEAPTETNPEPDENQPSGSEGEIASAVEMVQDARSLNYLSEDESRAIIARLASPTPSWEHIGEHIGMKPVVCANHHARGMQKLRVYRFIHRPDLYDGLREIRVGFESARIAHKEPLTEDEAADFQLCVLDRKGTRAQNTRGATLRRACEKVENQIRGIRYQKKK